MFFNIVVLFLLQVTFIKSSKYYVTTSQSSCPSNGICYNISDFIANSLLFRSNAIINFLEGTHYIQEGQLLVIPNTVSNLVIQGRGMIVRGFHETVYQSTVIIQCIGDNNGGLIVLGGSNIVFRSLTIIDCGINTQKFANIRNILSDSSLSNLVTTTSYFSFFAAKTVNLTFENISIQNGTEYGLLAVSINGLLIDSSSFARNSIFHSNRLLCETTCDGGNALIAYLTDCNNEQLTYSANIINSNFSFSIGASTQYVPSSGLLIFIDHANSYFVDVLLDSVVAYGNIGTLGANIALVSTQFANSYKFTMNNTLSTKANEQIFSSFGTTFGGGFLIVIGAPRQIPISSSQSCHNSERNSTIEILNSNFTNNAATYGSGLGIIHLNDLRKTSFKLTSSYVLNNAGILGTGLTIVEFSVLSNLLDVVLSNVSFIQCNADFDVFNAFLNSQDSANFFNVLRIQARDFASMANLNIHSSVVTFIEVENATLENVIIKDNLAAGILATHSVIIYRGKNNLIENNNASIGGGLSLLQQSFLFLEPSAQVRFINNSALRGGAIVSESSFVNICFFAIKSSNVTASSINEIEAKLVFINNRAMEAGSVLFGGDIDNCIPHPNNELFYLPNASRIIFDTVFNYTLQVGNSVISSDPFKVCICNGDMAVCLQRTYSTSVVPGDTISLPLVLVGEQEGFSAGILYMQPNSSHLSSQATLQQTKSYCQNITFLVTLADTNITNTSIELSVRTAGTAVTRPTENVMVTININKCPVGFQLLETGSFKGICGCHSLIDSYFSNITCNITERSIIRQSTGWIGYDNTSSCILVHDYCPFDYCVTNTVNLSLSNDQLRDRQCTSNRGGILCGQCREGFSLLLGSNECGDCPSYWHLLLLFVFILAGMILVVVLIVLNLTVSMTTINGLVFFANIVHINEAIVFSQIERIPVLFQFISWINLDFGFQICFYKEMDAYVKTWLQFAFPFYIWFIMIVIIMSARRSSRISVLVSRNAVPVLATLLLLSYTKLFRAVIFSLSRSELTTNCSAPRAVWTIDGNIDYLSDKHIPLFLFSLVILVALGIPYTLSLLLSPLLESFLSRYKCFKWWIKFKPIIDAYNGPYKDRCRFWTGLLLMARLVIVLTVSFSGNVNIDRLVTVMTCITLLTIGWVVGGIYTKVYSNVLESFFIANLAAVISVSGLDIPHLTLKILISVLLAVSFIVFLGIITYHIGLKCIEIRFVKWCINICRSDKSLIESLPKVELHEFPRKGSDVDVPNRSDEKKFTASTVIDIAEQKDVICVARESLIFTD